MTPGTEREEVSDEALMLRYQRGDRSAFIALLRRHQTAVYNFVLRQLGSALPADEIAQEVFLSVVREAAHFDYETPFATRLFAIAYALVRDERARMPERRWLQHGSAPPDSVCSKSAGCMVARTATPPRPARSFASRSSDVTYVTSLGA